MTNEPERTSAGRLGRVRDRVDKVSRLWFVCSDLHSNVVTNQASAQDLAEMI